VLRAVAGIRRLYDAEAALDLLRRAAALDPLSTSTLRQLGMRCLHAGHVDEAWKALNTALDLNPKSGLIHCMLSATRLTQGLPAEALALAEREVIADFRLLGVSLAERALGHTDAADKALAQLIDEYGGVAAYQIAIAYALRGDADNAFAWLERAYDQRDPGMTNLVCDRFLGALRDDPRWPQLMRRMGFA